MTRVTIDRIEEGVAVLVADGLEVEFPLAWLPEGAAEGDALYLELRLDPAATRAARDATGARRARLARDDDGGDFSL